MSESISKVHIKYGNYRRCLNGNMGEIMYFQSSFLYLGSSALEECQNRPALSILLLFPGTCILQIDINESWYQRMTWVGRNLKKPSHSNASAMGRDKFH